MIRVCTQHHTEVFQTGTEQLHKEQIFTEFFHQNVVVLILIRL